MHPRASTAHWTEVLAGIDERRCLDRYDEMVGWGLQRVDQALAADTVDAMVAATLLVEGIDRLGEAGVERARLLKKLRTSEFWATWAEIRIADVLLRSTEEGMSVELEPGRAGGAHPDWRFTYEGGFDGMAVEVKAVGLSDDEVAFCSRMATSFRRLLPKAGLTTVHARIDVEEVTAPGQLRRSNDSRSRRASRTVPGFPMGLRGITVVGHGAEESYRRRIAARVQTAVRQLPAGDECWVALYWSNGAPLAGVGSAIDWATIPPYVAGIVLVGQGVAFPHREVHCFATSVRRDEDPVDFEVESLLGDEMSGLAKLVLDRFEQSSGVRPTLLRVGNRDLILRDGTQRLLPFNLLMDRDPDELSEPQSKRP